MPVTNDTPTTFTCVDPMGTRHDPKFTESAGMIVGAADNGYFTTSRPEVAQELQEKYPHMLVTRHEKYHGNRATRPMIAVSLTFAEMAERYQHYLEAQQGAVTPQEDSPHGEQPTA